MRNRAGFHDSLLLLFQFAVPQDGACAFAATKTSGGLQPNAAREAAARARRAGLSGKGETNRYARRHSGMDLLPLQHQLTFFSATLNFYA
jgi:hypothetical protein